jgi:hypothetical protein
MFKKEASIETPNMEFLNILDNYELVDTLLGGTDVMRAAGEKYLPKEPNETNEAYQNRLNRSVLYNAYADTLKKLIGKPFSKPITLKDDTHEIIKGWCDNLDLCGNNITSFARELFQKGLNKGLVHVLVDYPKNDKEKFTLEDQQKSNIRPYAVIKDASELFAWSFEDDNGVKKLTQIRLLENTTEPDGKWGQKTTKKIRVIYTDKFEVWQEKKKDKWQIVEEGENTLGKIPLITFYTERTGFMVAKPPMLDLAHLNIQHWQSSSDQEHILHFIRFPLLHGAGFSSDAKEMEIGPNRMITSEDPQARLNYVEHSGAAVEAGRQSIKDIEEKMDSMGNQLLIKKPGNTTATATSIDTAKSNSALQGMTRRLENVFEQIFQLMSEWSNLKLDYAGGININQDFGISLVNGKDEDTLLKSRMAGEITSKTYLSELKRRNVLRDDLNIDDELNNLEIEGRDFNNKDGE